jgi:hypothetical protein
MADAVICYGGARPGDGNFADVVAIDAGIIRIIEQRQRRRQKRISEKSFSEPACKS